MKIYNKSYFFMGLFCLGAIPLFVSDIVPVDWWQYGITIGFSSLFLYRGLSKEGSERDRVFREYFKETALSMYGPLYSIKVNLPWILIFIFFPFALILRAGVSYLDSNRGSSCICSHTCDFCCL